MNDKEKWAKIVERGPILLPTFEHARSAGNLYAYDSDGELDLEDILGTMPNTYYDKSYRDYWYYSFSAWTPCDNDMGSFYYSVFDEDEGTYEPDNVTYTEVDPEDFDLFLGLQTEADFLMRGE